MSFVLFLRGMIGVLIVFAIASYIITQSWWATLIQTVICAVVIQVGYFAAVMFLVWRSGAKPQEKNSEASPPAARDADADGKQKPVQGIRRSPLS